MSKGEWDLVMDLDFEKSFFKGLIDGALITFSPTEVNSEVGTYDPADASDFGYIRKLNGLAILVRLSKTAPSSNSVCKNLITRSQSECLGQVL